MGRIDFSSSQVFTEENCETVLALTHCNVENVNIFVFNATFFEDVELLDLLEVSQVANFDFCALCDSVLIVVSDIHSHSTFIIVFVDWHFEIVELGALEYAEVRLPVFVRHTILSFGTNDHLSTIHEIVHDTLQLRDQGVLILENVNIDLFISRYLESLVASHEENVASHLWDLEDLFPFPDALRLV